MSQPAHLRRTRRFDAAIAPRSFGRRRMLVAAACLAAIWPVRAPAEDAGNPDFALFDHLGRRRRLSDWRGKVIVLTFGYTQCPDVCPTTLGLLAEVMRDLGSDATNVQVLFATVDPARDTQAVLAQYVPAFDPRFIGLRGSEAATARAAQAFDVRWAKHPGRTARTYSVDHTAASFVLDRDTRLRSVIAYGQGPQVFVRDIARLLAEPLPPQR